MTESQEREFGAILQGMKGYDAMFKDLYEFSQTEGGSRNIGERLRKLETSHDALGDQVRAFVKSGRAFSSREEVRWIGNVPFVSDACAEALTAALVLGANKIENCLERLAPNADTRQRVLQKASALLGAQTRAALTSAEIPLPTIYVPQIIELVWKYGQARQYCTVYPLGAGTVKLPRLKAGEDRFSYFGAGTAGMSQAITEKKVEAENVTFTANKCGGILRIPVELEEDTFIPLGQFLARYIARNFARLEDDTVFDADGSGTYALQTGLGPYCNDSGALTYSVQLGGTKTKPSDATLADFRAIRAKVSPAILAGGFQPRYFINSSFEPMLRSFNTYPNFIVFERDANGNARFDGFPVVWLGVSQSYSNAAAPGADIAFFGDLSYVYLGERGFPRVETSREVYFATDEIAMRALERIDVEIVGIDAMSSLRTADA